MTGAVAAAVLLYGLAAAMAWGMWRRCRGLDLDALLARDAREHERIRCVLAAHPHGGTWRELQRWLAECELEAHEASQPARHSQASADQ